MPVDLSSVFNKVAAENLASEVLLATFRSPLEAATHYITAKYTALGGAAGILGATDGEISPCPDGQGFFRHFWNNGSIYWTPGLGAHAVHGAIREKWASMGWERSFLGYPVTDEIAGDNPQTSGAFQIFQGGAIYTYSDLRLTLTTVTVGAQAITTAAVTAAPQRVGGATVTANLNAARLAATNAATNATTRATTSTTPRTSTADRAATGVFTGVFTGVAIRPPKPSIATTHEVHGAILGKYQDLGGESSFLGYPTTDESGTPDGVGRFNHFQAGSIYWTPNTGAHEVHGLIRDFWSAHGWERNPALAYPISDESIPDRRIGHVKPETTRKPILNLPADVLKLPVEAVNAGGIPEGAVNVMTRAKTFTSTGTVGLNLGVLAGLLTPQPASTAAPERSVNRFSDFENGVVFWGRGASAAVALTPWTKAADGTVIQKSAADVAAATLGHLGGALQLPHGTIMPPAPAGTTPYAWDGAGVQNRRHQIQFSVMVLAGDPIPTPRVQTVMLYVLVMFEPERRKMTAFIVDYATSEPAFGPRLDPLLWSPFDLLTFPDTNDGEPYSILSVKTMVNGDVNTYIEPKSRLSVIDLGVFRNDIVGRIG
ncbi:MAG: hypothetical protein JWP63_5837 [Candidatus Solibacter sp.]|nr:hypothetical protein [Candidatus Solibacter sp.]